MAQIHKSPQFTAHQEFISARRQTAFEIVRRNSDLIPDHIAVEFESRTWSYRELLDVSSSVAEGLRRLGVEPGDRLAAYGYNSDWYVIFWLATQALNAVHVPINFMLTANEVAYILGDSEPRFVVADVALLDVVREAVGDGPVGLGTFASSGGVHFAVEDLAQASLWLEEVATDDRTNDSMVQLAYTSGTESAPKGVMLSATGLVAEYVSCIVAGRYSANDVVVHALPLYHCAQMHCFLMPYLYLGARNIIVRNARPADVQDVVSRVGASSFFAAPTVWISILRDPDFDPARYSTLRKGFYGASIMPVETIRELDRVLPQLQLWNYYGQTELGPLATYLPPEDQLRKPGSAGRPVLNVETRVVDEQMQDVAPGEVGEIVHRSPQATLGYWRLPEKTAETYSGGWFHSGDLGVLDDEGYLMVVDRKKDMINSGGENVASREVEDALYLHPAVSEVAVVGLPHPKWIESVVAVVVRKGGGMEEVREGELIDFARSRLAPFKVPKQVFFVEELPKNPSGKILKRVLRDSLEDRVEA